MALPSLILVGLGVVGRGDGRVLPTPPPPQARALSEIREHPASDLGRRLTLVLQVDRCVEAWNPWFSRFAPSRWVALRGWADEALLWEADAFEDPFARAFVRRGTIAERLLRSLRRFDRVEVVATVREVQFGEPWIEVHSLRRLPTRVGEGTLIHVGRALELVRRGHLQLALDQLERAAAAPLPALARRALDELSADCLREIAFQRARGREPWRLRRIGPRIPRIGSRSR